MAQKGKRYATLKSWEHARTIDVELSDGTYCSYRVPDLHAYLACGTIPNPLVDMALRIDSGVVKEPELNQEERKAYFDLQCWVIATHLERPDLVGELGEEGALAWVANSMHPDDRALLWSRSVHSFDAEEVVESLMKLLPFRDRESGDDVDERRGGGGAEAV